MFRIEQNKSEKSKKMLDETWRNKIAEAHVKAIIDIEKAGLNF
jgi:hypothetical protein